MSPKIQTRGRSYVAFYSVVVVVVAVDVVVLVFAVAVAAAAVERDSCQSHSDVAEAHIWDSKAAPAPGRDSAIDKDLSLIDMDSDNVTDVVADKTAEAEESDVGR